MAKYVYRPGAGVDAQEIIGTVHTGEPKPGLACVIMLEDGKEIDCDSGMTARYFPVVGDYLVTQPDGYRYLNPKKVFEDKFQRVGEEQ